jgi:hypothetical protein
LLAHKPQEVILYGHRNFLAHSASWRVLQRNTAATGHKSRQMAESVDDAMILNIFSHMQERLRVSKAAEVCLSCDLRPRFDDFCQTVVAISPSSTKRDRCAYHRSDPPTISRNRGPTLVAVLGVSHTPCPQETNMAVRPITGATELRLFVTANTPAKSASFSLTLPK